MPAAGLDNGEGQEPRVRRLWKWGRRAVQPPRNQPRPRLDLSLLRPARPLTASTAEDRFMLFKPKPVFR